MQWFRQIVPSNDSACDYQFILFICLSTICWLATSVLPAWGDDNKIDFSIPPSNAGIALNLFAKQADLQLLYPYEVVNSVELKGLSGHYSAEEGIQLLLRGSCLQTEFNKKNNDHSVHPKNSKTKGVVIMKITDCKRIGMLSALSAALASALSPGGAIAQENLQAQRGMLEEIVVTARRVEENLQVVPVSVSAFSPGRLEELKIFRMDDLQTHVPTLRVGSSTLGERNRPNLALRGLRTNGVVTYFADVPTSQFVVGRMLYDLSSIQVVKGPQGTLFGLNTTAGAVLFEPAKPTDEIEGSIEMSYGSYERFGTQGMLNIPVSDTLKIRFAADVVDRDGYVEVLPVALPVGTTPRVLRDQDSERSDSQRVSIDFTPSDNFDNLTIIHRFHADEESSARKLLSFASCPENPTFGQTLTLGACRYRPPFSDSLGLGTFDEAAAAEVGLPAFKTYNQNTGRNYMLSWGVTNHSMFRISDALSVKSIIGYQNDELKLITDPDGTTFDLSTVNTEDEGDQYTAELQLQGEYDRLQWIIGGFYRKQEATNYGKYGLAEPQSFISPVLLNSTTRNDTRALFAQTTYDITERLSATAGYRHSWETKESVESQRQGPTLGCILNPTNVGVDISNCNSSRRGTWKEPSWTLGLDYKINDQLFTYLTVRRGFNAGGFTPIPFRPTYDSEVINDIEVGLKGDWRLYGATIRTNLAVYRSKYENIQRAARRFLGDPPTVFQITDNAAEATVWGIDAQVDAYFSPYFELSANIGWIDAEYGEYVTESAPGVTVDLSANALALAPELGASISPTVKLPVPEGFARQLAISATWSYTSRVYFSDTNGFDPYLSNRLDTFATQPSYSLFNASINLQGVMGTAADVSIYVKNLTDELYAISLQNNLDTYGMTTGSFGDPRTWGVAVKYKF